MNIGDERDLLSSFLVVSSNEHLDEWDLLSYFLVVSSNEHLR